MSVGVVQGYVVRPSSAGLPCCREYVVVLIEVVGCLLPIASIVHFIAVGLVFPIRIGWKTPFVVVEHQAFVEWIKASQTTFVQVFVGLYVAAHQRCVVVSSHNTVPSLSCFLEITYVLISYLEVIAQVCEPTIVRTRPACRSVKKSIGSCFVVSTVEYEMVAKQTR